MSDLRHNFLRINTCRKNILQHSIHRNNILNLEEVYFLKVEDEEEDLVMEEDKSFVVIMDNLDISRKIALIL